MGKTLRLPYDPSEHSEPGKRPERLVSREEIVWLCNMSEWEARDKFGIPDGKPVPKDFRHPWRDELLERHPDQKFFNVTMPF